MRAKEETIEEYFNLSEESDLGSAGHSGGWSSEHKDPQKIWGHGMCFIYYNRNTSFKFKNELWHKHTSRIIKIGDMELISNDTPFSNAEVKKALHQKWFAQHNEEIRVANNRKARQRRANKKEVAL